jgi:hypothetical protein
MVGRLRQLNIKLQEMYQDGDEEPENGLLGGRRPPNNPFSGYLSRVGRMELNYEGNPPTLRMTMTTLP